MCFNIVCLWTFCSFQMFTITNDATINMFDDVENSPGNKIIRPKAINIFMAHDTNVKIPDIKPKPFVSRDAVCGQVPAATPPSTWGSVVLRLTLL